jgi:dihydroanticapsin dehydrogenase
VDTPFNTRFITFQGDKDAHQEVISASVPLGREALPPEMASLLAFVISDEAS